ncbi:MAG: nucleoside hydrolase [Candidatus Omnitrophota bacterium]
MVKKRILLDCDPGIDDALAIFLALGHADIELNSIVATYGNMSLEQVRENLSGVLGFFDAKDLPRVGSGSRHPIAGKSVEARHVHGEDGLGGRGRLLRKADLKFDDGVDVIIDSVLSEKIDTIVATGPLTDLARAVKKEPLLADFSGEIVIMGGAVSIPGNVTPESEYNFYCDPDAASIVLNLPVRKRLVSLDVTRRVLLTEKHVAALGSIDADIARFIADIGRYSIDFHRRARNMGGACVHDALAMGLVIDEGIGKYEDLRLDVETKDKGRGRVIIKDGPSNVRFCREADTDRFFDILIKTYVKLAEQ